MKEIHALVGQIGWSEAPVLIQGETGTGKEVIARELHAQSRIFSRPAKCHNRDRSDDGLLLNSGAPADAIQALLGHAFLR